MYYIRRNSANITNVPLSNTNPFLAGRTKPGPCVEYWRADFSLKYGGEWVTDVTTATGGTEDQAREALAYLPRLRGGAGAPEVVGIFTGVS